MNIKKLFLIIFALSSVAQIAAPLYMVYGKEKVAIEGTEFKFKCAPRDPHDPFRGKYVALNFEAENSKWDFAMNNEVDNEEYVAYAILKNDDKGYAKIIGIELTQPKDISNCIKVVARKYWQPEWGKGYWRLSIELPFREYYMNEDKAPLAEKAYWGNQATAYATVRVLDGEAVMTGLYIDGVPVEKYIETHQNR